MRVQSIVQALCAAAALFAGTAEAAPRPVAPPDPTIAKSLKRFPGLARLSCSGIASLSLPHARVIFAALNPAGGFAVPGTTVVLPGLPEFCRVVVLSTPTPDSKITIEVWVPTDSYRARYLQVGNGGFSGSVVYLALADGVQRGYATASTDDGSQAAGAGSFAMGHPEKVVDYGYRALKETSDTSRAIIRALKGADPGRAYFHGCSNGGRQ
ncbi:MAG: tannase/feruloyl esterase family alpha/beta hydrolase, partial [Parvularculaceae bacterium]|nr:tannase/feruloyl esterase family alpha/beta hydrolase [Parvularculaceae bacterium]